MANEFVARRGIIAQSGGAKITGSLLVSGNIDATGYNIIASSLTGSFSGSIGTAISASFATTASAATSITFTPLTASFATTASAASSITFTPLTASFSTTASAASSITFTPATASFATTASYAAFAADSVDTITVTNNGASYYLLDGVVKPVVTFVPGTTYRFNTSGVVGSHPFRFSLTANGPTEYTSGVTVGTGYTEINVDYATSSSLFYYCTNHSGMGNAATTLRSENLITAAQTGSMSVLSSSFAISASHAIISNTAITASFATTASAASSITFTPTTASFATTASAASSITFIPTTASFSTTASAASSITFTPTTASFATTASAANSITFIPTTASFAITASFATNVPTTASFAISASHAIVANSASNVLYSAIGQKPTLVSSSAQFTTLANPFTGSFTGSFTGDGSGLVNIPSTTPISIDTYTFAGTGATTAYVLSQSYSVNSLVVSVAGLTQINSIDYSLSGTTLTFVSAPFSASNILVRAFVAVTSNATGSFSGSFFGNATTATTASYALTASFASNVPATSSFAISASHAIVADSASNVLYSAIGQKPTLVSSSAQVVWSSVNYNTDIVSSSAQYPGWVTASSQVALTGITGTTFASSNFTFPLNLTVGGTLTAERIQTEYITSSIIYESGSTKFGDTSDDTHQFTGSVLIAGPVSASAGFTGSFKGDGSQLTGLATTLRVTGSNASTDTINLVTDGITFAGGNGVTTSIASDILTISAPAGTVTASSQIALTGITGTTFATSNFTFPQQLIVSGIFSGSTSAIINNSVYSGSLVTGIVGPVSNQVVASIAVASCDGVFFDYVVKDGTNYRTGTVMVTSNGTTVEYTDTSTADIGNTAQAIFVVDIASSIIRLKFTNTSGTWVVKTTIRAL